MKKVFLAAVLCMGTSTAALAHDKDGWVDHKVDNMFMMMDTNKDGSISAEENEAGAKKMFVDADSSGDHMVTKDELKAYFKAKKGEWTDKPQDHSPKEKVQ